MCGITFEHAESAKMLTNSGNYTSSIALVRLQYEALVRAMWVFYSASDIAVSKLICELTQESASKANKLPMLSEMLEKLEGKAPQMALDMLNEFKEYSWKPLCSFIHSGIYAVSHQNKGYPKHLLHQLVKISNGVSIMVGMLLVILANDINQRGKIPALQKQFENCLPDYKY